MEIVAHGLREVQEDIQERLVFVDAAVDGCVRLCALAPARNACLLDVLRTRAVAGVDDALCALILIPTRLHGDATLLSSGIFA